MDNLKVTLNFVLSILFSNLNQVKVLHEEETSFFK